MTAVYDRIGVGYTATRREDPALSELIVAKLGSACTVVNVGAGAGSYEPRGRPVVAIEPSDVMAAQRQTGIVAAVSGRAESLPLVDDSVDAAMAVLTLHHWEDQERGVRELRRVARGPVVIVTFDHAVSNRMWLMERYLPEVAALDQRIFPPPALITEWLGSAAVETWEIPRHTPDWTLGSFWAHPERVLDPVARAATSGFARMTEEVVTRVVSEVSRDLDNGDWDRRYGNLRRRVAYDAGIRIIVAPGDSENHGNKTRMTVQR